MIKNNQKNEIHGGLTAFGLAVIMAVGFTTPSMAQEATKTVTAPAPTYRFVLDPAYKAAPDAIALTPDQAYDETKGYGFTNTKGGNEIALALKAAPGDYRVRVTLGQDKKTKSKTGSRTSVWAEDRRLMLAPVVLKKGESRTVEFFVNVRDPNLVVSEQDVIKTPKVLLRGDEPTQSRDWDDKLTIAFSGSALAIQAIEIQKATPARRVFIVGDSTVADQGGADYASWGQMLPRFLSSELSVANHARSGETMKSFITSLRWDKVMSEVRPGDILLIQFGHNDQKKQWPRTYVAAARGYPAYLKALVADAQDHGVQVVLISPVSRRSFKDGKINNTLAGYDDAVRNTAKDLGIPFIDLTAKTKTLYEALGPEISPLAFANSGKDGTHHNAYGAFTIANYVAQAITDPANSLDLRASADFVALDPAKPVDPKAFEIQPADWPLMREVVAKVSGN
ncbi:rhamnogalacturonan acetylesterase [Asticcacaulis sp. BYS171W]|uniref:Rhamnogalacturonan acetylesterase n=1 Tax=Asticcacaulis aquaticus TaxID=2984212 RepID=A0ABT5HXZ5_9CAUL|nr:rhamnogalacturonan acetylesterase [Asticcacaulis aquaticus]MDC7684957.1 rhamnogalacturonan acetylesterase [Asticcacaulis aquaticus]